MRQLPSRMHLHTSLLPTFAVLGLFLELASNRKWALKYLHLMACVALPLSRLTVLGNESALTLPNHGQGTIYVRTLVKVGWFGHRHDTMRFK